MKRLALPRWLPTLTGVLVALLGCGLAAPPPARASCGSYVTVATHPDQAPTPSADRPRADAVRLPPCSRHAPRDPHLPPRPPCEGPSCSGGPVAPAPASTSSCPDSRERWDCLLNLPVFVPAQSRAPALDDPPPRPVRRAGSVYHPPRPF